MPVHDIYGERPYIQEVNIELEPTINPRLENAFRDPLTEVVRYYLQGRGHLSLKQELCQQMFLSVVAISGAGLYAVPADAYARSEQAELAGRINYMISTCIPALVVLYNSTELFLGMRAAENIPEKLTHYLKNSFTARQKIVENTIITLGSAISAFPLAAVSFLYPIPGLPKSIIVLQSIVVEFDNTILHFLPIKLALQSPLYRLPILPFEFIFKKLIHYCRSPEERQKKQLQKQIDQYFQVIKQQLIAHLEHTKNLLAIYGFKFEGCGFNYNNHAADKINDLYRREQSPLQLLEELFKLIHAISPDRPINPPSTINNVLRKLVYIPGAFWVVSSCAGFLVAPINEMTELTGNNIMGAGFSVPSVYFLGVLLAYFGGNSLQNTYDYFTSWQDDAIKIPKEFKYYPKTSILLVIIALYLSAFSYAAGAELIKDNFKGDLEFLRPELLVLAKTGLAFLGFTAMLDFFCNILKKFSQYGYNEEAKTVTKLSEALSQLKNSIQLMKSDQFITSLSNLEGDRLKSILNIRQNADNDALREVLLKLQKLLEEKLTLELKSTTSRLEVDYTPVSRYRQLLSEEGSTPSSESGISYRVTRANSSDATMTTDINRRVTRTNSSDATMEADINRRVTRTNSSDATSIAAGIYHPPYSHEYIHRSGSFMKLKKQLNRQLFAVKKLISTLDELPIVETDNLSPNSPDYSERSRLITPFFSHRPIGSYINNNSQYGYGSISPETLGETSFSFTD